MVRDACPQTVGRGESKKWLNTPVGWARANLMLRTLQAPPPPGSLREWLLILLLDRMEDIEHARFRALAQIIIDKESGIEAFEDYMKIAFPSLENRKKAQAQQVHDALRGWVAQGPLKVTPLVGPRRSRLKERVLARMASREQAEKHNEVSKQWQQRT